MEPLILFAWFIAACFCAFIARSKNRSGLGWFFLGLLFPVLSLIALIAVPVKGPRYDQYGRPL